MKNNLTGVVYRIYNKLNGKSYIGQTTEPDRRIRRHYNGRGNSPHLANAIKIYGKESFHYETLEDNVPEELLSKLEILNIRFFGSLTPNGYNLTIGGEGTRGYKASEETKRKISKANKGRTLSSETRQKMSKARKGRPGKPRSSETRRKLSESMMGEKNPNYGKSLTSETRQKMSKAKKGRPGKPRSSESIQKYRETCRRRRTQSSPLQFDFFSEL